ncbi:MAG: preprotein translocase subunit YajC [Clostridia bacterium]|nr:preprotein translocase subunit YajC [Clostridia bacterium]
MIVILLFFVVYMWMMSRREKKSRNEEQAMRDSLKVGDEVVTIGGILGKVVSVKDETVVLETGADRNKIRFTKAAIATNASANARAQADKEAKEAAKAKEKAAKKDAKKKD